MKDVMAEEADETSASAGSMSQQAASASAAAATPAAAESGEAGPNSESATALSGSGPNLAMQQSQQSLQRNTGTTTMTTTTTTTSLDDDKILNTSAVRMRKFPNLNYSTLYHSLLNLIDVVPNIQTGQIGIGQALIHTFGCLAPFLADDLIDSLPYTIALTLTSFPRDLHKYIMEVLCNSLLPIASTNSTFKIYDFLGLTKRAVILNRRLLRLFQFECSSKKS